MTWYRSRKKNSGSSIESFWNTVVADTQDFNLTAPYLTEIGNYGFHRRSHMKGVDLLNVTTVGSEGFSWASVTSVNLPSATTLGNNAFYYCRSLTSVNIPNATVLGGGAFHDCNVLTSINCPAVVTSGDSTFWGCKALTSLNVSNMTTAGSSFVRDCSELTSVYANSVSSVTGGMFHTLPKLTTVNIESATSIGAGGFTTCTALITLDMPSVTLITNFAFQYSSALQNLILRSPTMCSIQNNALELTRFASGGAGGNIYVPQALIPEYEADTNWSRYLAYPNNQILPIEGSEYE